ncbi:hypothetical protein BKA82DRAFT_4361265 [Pisolithus tinctorius]|nr:hypothetical protein BKA82DRAFT_4361265 [Pisolithus tinctorius]
MIQSVGGEGKGCLKEGHTTVKENAFLGSCTCSVQSVVIPILLLANLYFPTTADLDVGNIAAQLGKTLLGFGLVIFAHRGVCKKSADLFAARLNDILGNLTVKENGALLLDIELVGEDGTTGEDGKAVKDGFPLSSNPGPWQLRPAVDHEVY